MINEYGYKWEHYRQEKVKLSPENLLELTKEILSQWTQRSTKTKIDFYIATAYGE